MTEMNEGETHHFEVMIGNLLRVGVLLSALVGLIGAALYLARYGNTHPTYHVFKGEPSDLRSVHKVVQDSFAAQSRSILQLGLILLIATPFARVFMCVFVFLKHKDWVYTGFTLFVLGILTYSLFGH